MKHDLKIDPLPLFSIDKTKEPICEVFYAANNVKIGHIESLLELNRLRVQIKNNQLKEPYSDCVVYILFQSERIKIDSNGRIGDCPAGFYDENLDLLCELL